MEKRIKINEEDVIPLKKMAVEDGKSFSQWITDALNMLARGRITIKFKK